MDVESPGSQDRIVRLGVCVGVYRTQKREPAAGGDEYERLKEIKKVLKQAEGERQREEGSNPAGNQLSNQQAENG